MHAERTETVISAPSLPPAADGLFAPKHQGDSDPDLTAALRAAQQGDQASFGLIYHTLQPKLLRYLRTLVRADAEDVASEAWLQIGRDLRAFRGNWRQWRTWAITIARHRAMDHLRREQRRPLADVPLDHVLDREANDNTETTVLNQITSDATLALVTSLPPREAEAVLLRILIGMNATEAGRILGTQPGSVRSAAHRGLRKLAHRIDHSGLRSPNRPGPLVKEDRA